MPDNFKIFRDTVRTLNNPQDKDSASAGQRYKSWQDRARTLPRSITDENGVVNDLYLVGYTELDEYGG